MNLADLVKANLMGSTVGSGAVGQVLERAPLVGPLTQLLSNSPLGHVTGPILGTSDQQGASGLTNMLPLLALLMGSKHSRRS